jgi:aconitase B
MEKGILLKATQTRQDMDKASITLANRIAMLQNEEKKLMKKIEETRTRADNILALKQANDVKYQAKMSVEMNRGSDVTLKK